MTIEEESAYSSPVYKRVAARVREQEVQDALPAVLKGALLYVSPTEQLFVHASLSMLSLWEAILFARTMSIVLGMGGDYILRAPKSTTMCSCMVSMVDPANSSEG